MAAQPDNYAGQVRSFIALNFLVGRVATRALLHRLRHGPRRADWSLLYELVVAIMALTIPDDESTTVEQMRHEMAQLGTAPLPQDVSVTPAEVGGVACEWVSVPGCRTEGVLLYLHGGGYVTGSPVTYRSLVAEISRQTRIACARPGLPACARTSLSRRADRCLVRRSAAAGIRIRPRTDRDRRRLGRRRPEPGLDGCAA